MPVCGTVCASPSRDGIVAFVTLDRSLAGARVVFKRRMPRLPQLYYNSDFAHDGSYTLRMSDRCVYALPELSPEVEIESLRMEMYVRQPNAFYQLEVGVWDETTSSFEPVALVDNATTGVEYFACDFSGYTGEGRRIAFRNTLVSGVNYTYSYNYIDGLVLSKKKPCGIDTLPYRESFDSYTTSTVAATGVELECWEVVWPSPASNMSRPQLYYNSDFAHDGSYTLRMSDRCVYALPELSPEVEIESLQMEMYVRQPNAFYQLEVGVWDETTSSFEPVALVNNSTTGVEYFACDFSGYTGEGRRIAFRNTLVSGVNYSYSYNYIDDISFTVNTSKIAVDEEVGVGETESERYLDNISVYPNPTTGVLQIDAVDVQRVECYSQMGQLVGVYENVNELNISDLAKGVYVLRITVPQGVTMRKVVKR